MKRLDIVIILIALGSTLFFLEMVRRRQLKEKYALLWIGVGVVGVIFSLARPLLDKLSSMLGIAYAPSTFFLFSIVFLIAVSAHLSWEISRLEERCKRLAEEIAILQAKDLDRERNVVGGVTPGE